jgi:hypothetical protein
MTEGTYRPASSIEPGWQVWVDGQWLTVDMAIETERDDGLRVIRFYFADQRRSAAAAKTDLVRSKTPKEVN